MLSMIERQRREQIARELMENYREALFSGDRLKMYQCLSTEYQRSVPLNQFTAPREFNDSLPSPFEIISILANPEVREIWISIRTFKENLPVDYDLRSIPDYGGWKLDANTLEDWML